ncbi:hypothetical protein GPECTOR_316g15 [Gonium pectorale]|uniref:Uncharacterized protein n=1 Tax=Gonium pectorale TaxID=33097 RepID=A0A150FVR3_GONPE|nr:hypothetical protein GPECTOR_316g15 [Gonium pectorale]|eukprot:KXZ41696.1 hypothetical protein GPECTOR_316g15 [Gonium pectorale]
MKGTQIQGKRASATFAHDNTQPTNVTPFSTVPSSATSTLTPDSAPVHQQLRVFPLGTACKNLNSPLKGLLTGAPAHYLLCLECPNTPGKPVIHVFEIRDGPLLEDLDAQLGRRAVPTMVRGFKGGAVHNNVLRRLSGMSVQQWTTTETTNFCDADPIDIADLPRLHTDKIRYPTHNKDDSFTDPWQDGSALLVLPYGLLETRTQSTTKLGCYVATSPHDAAHITLCFNKNTTPQLQRFYQDAADRRLPLYLLGNNLYKGSEVWTDSIISIPARATKSIKDWISKLPAQTAAGQADVLWDNRASAASVLPSDTSHPDSHFAPVVTGQVTVQRDGHTINVIPGVLTSSDHAYPACITDPNLLSKLPDFTTTFDDFASADANDIMDYCAEPFMITGNMTTHTDPATRTTYITDITNIH